MKSMVATILGLPFLIAGAVAQFAYSYVALGWFMAKELRK